MEAKYLAYDSESGGLSFAKHPILTAYFAAVSEDLAVIDELDLKIRPDLTKYVVEQEALDVNGIKLEEHLADPALVSPEEAKALILAFTKKHKPKGRGRLKPLGQNIFFDDMFIFTQLVPQDEWEKSVHYGRIDTKVISDLMKDIGILPPDIGTLASLVEHFQVQKRTAHEAKSDVLMTIDVYAKMIDTLKGLKNNASLIGGDILSQIER